MDVKPSQAPDGDEFRALAAELRAAFEAWEPGVCDRNGEDGGRWDDVRFRELSLRCFRIQYRENAPYRRYCDRRGAAPGSVEDWRQIPPVPTAGFRAVPLVVGGREAAELEFRTSGTTGGRRRGRHYVRDPRLYRASLEAGFRHFVLRRRPVPEAAGAGSASAGGAEPRDGSGPALQPPVRMLSLIPSYTESSRSSLSWMVDGVLERFGAESSLRAAGRDGIDWETAAAAARAAAEAGEPLCVLTTTLGACEWMEELKSRSQRLPLPAGSVVMDTGGAKGRPGLEREDVLRSVEERLAVPPERTVNEFGMTELLSQRYGAGVGPRGPCLRGPPWLRTRALHPVTLEELPPGREGVLCHFDLANAGSVSAVLTEDMGTVRGDAMSYSGRAAGAPPRGCSLATSELLHAQRESLS